jgi:hypothetical protein
MAETLSELWQTLLTQMSQRLTEENGAKEFISKLSKVAKQILVIHIFLFYRHGYIHL